MILTVAMNKLDIRFPGTITGKSSLPKKAPAAASSHRSTNPDHHLHVLEARIPRLCILVTII